MMNILSVENWFEEFEAGPLYIAGPCSAESQEQLNIIASLFDPERKPHLMRAGIWKPRTRPGSFQGFGAKGLKWLKKASESYGIRTVVEAATPEHVEACLKCGIDVIWLGARTVSNPFSVQEIAESLSGVDIPIMVKNPLNPDIDLWIGALERFNRAGITKLAAVHRGFAPFERTMYRNMPKWDIPIELRRRYASLPIICDPSHMAGDASLVPELAQKALDLNMDGLMIEVHNDPASALSDCNQQLTPLKYNELMSKLKVRKLKLDDPGFSNYLEELRDQVDSVDHQMVELIARRFELSDLIGDYKSRNNVAILQMERWLEILRTRVEQARLAGIDHNFTEKLLKLLHQESIRRQTSVLDELKKNGEISGNNGPGD